MKKENVQREKVSVNFMPRELGQIDALVEQGYYTDRSDLIRTAVRAELEKHTDDLKFILDNTFPHENVSKEENEFISVSAGIVKLGKKELRAYENQGKKLVIKMMGVLIIDTDVPVELVQKTVKSVKVWGKISASDEVKKVLQAY